MTYGVISLVQRFLFVKEGSAWLTPKIYLILISFIIEKIVYSFSTNIKIVFHLILKKYYPCRYTCTTGYVVSLWFIKNRDSTFLIALSSATLRPINALSAICFWHMEDTHYNMHCKYILHNAFLFRSELDPQYNRHCSPVCLATRE